MLQVYQGRTPAQHHDSRSWASSAHALVAKICLTPALLGAKYSIIADTSGHAQAA